MTDDPRTDVELVAAHRAGDQSAVVTVLDRYTPLIRGVASRVTTNHADLDDAAQDAAIRVWRHLGGHEGDSLRYWVSRIATNAAIDVVRAHLRDRRDGGEEYASVPDDLLHDRDLMVDPEARRTREEIRVRVHGAIAELPLWQARTVRLAMLVELPHVEVAEILGLRSHVTVRTRTIRAREVLAPILADLVG